MITAGYMNIVVLNCSAVIQVSSQQINYCRYSIISIIRYLAIQIFNQCKFQNLAIKHKKMSVKVCAKIQIAQNFLETRFPGSDTVSISASRSQISMIYRAQNNGRQSPFKMSGQLDFSSVDRSLIDMLTLTVKQIIRNLFRYITVSCFHSRRQQSHWKA